MEGSVLRDLKSVPLCLSLSQPSTFHKLILKEKQGEEALLGPKLLRGRAAWKRKPNLLAFVLS